MRLIDIENNLKALIEEDINNPEVFNTIKELAYLHIKRRGLMTNSRDAEETAILIAEELYMKILRGEPIYSWIGYISKSCIGYIRKYRKMTSSEIIDTADDYEMMQGIMNLSASSYNMTSKEYDKIIDRLSIDDLPNLIEEVVEKVCRYNRYSSQYINFVISTYISLIKGETTSIFLNESEHMQFGIVLTKVKEVITSKLGEQSRISSFANYSILQIFAMEGQQDE